MDQKLECMTRNHKSHGRKPREEPFDTSLGNAFFDLFLDMTPKADATK